MPIQQIMITVVITTAIIGALLIATAASFFPRTAEAHALHGGQGHGGWRHDGHRGWHGGTRGNPCASLELPLGKLAAVMIGEHLDLDAEQGKRLEPVIATLETWREDARHQCAGFDHSSVDASLRTLETFLRSSADRIAELQPAYAAFHATLNEAQQAHLAQAMQHRHGDAGARE